MHVFLLRHQTFAFEVNIVKVDSSQVASRQVFTSLHTCSRVTVCRRRIRAGRAAVQLRVDVTAGDFTVSLRYQRNSQSAEMERNVPKTHNYRMSEGGETAGSAYKHAHGPLERR